MSREKWWLGDDLLSFWVHFRPIFKGKIDVTSWVPAIIYVKFQWGIQDGPLPVRNRVITLRMGGVKARVTIHKAIYRSPITPSVEPHLSPVLPAARETMLPAGHMSWKRSYGWMGFRDCEAHVSGDSWMYPYQRTPIGNPCISHI